MIINVICFNTIFNKESVTKNIKCDVICNSKVMDCMRCYSTVKALMNGITFDVGFHNSPNAVEMYCISSNFISLTNVSQLNVLNSSNRRFITRWMEHNMSSKHVSLWNYWITSKYYISSQKTDFTLHRHINTTVCGDYTDMIE